MDKQIGIGIINGLIIGIGIFIYNHVKNRKQRKEEKVLQEKEKERYSRKINFEDKESKLRNLREKGVLSESEYQEKLHKLRDTELGHSITQTEEYIQLLSLYEEGLLDQNEFEKKVKKLKEDLLYKNKNNTERNTFQKENYTFDSRLLTFKGYNKAKDIFNKALIKNDSKTIEGLCTRLEQIFGVSRQNSAESFLQNILENLEKQYEIRIVGDFKEGLAKLMDDEGNFGFINLSYDIIVPTKYEFAEDFNEGLALVRLDRRFGFIDKRGQVVISLVYDNANSFKNGEAKVEKGKNKFLINKKGEKVWHSEF